MKKSSKQKPSNKKVGKVTKKSSQKAKKVDKKVSSQDKVKQTKTKQKTISKKKSVKKVVSQSGGSGSRLKPVDNKKAVKKEADVVDEKAEKKKQRQIDSNKMDLAFKRWELAVESGAGRKDRVQELFKEYKELHLKTKDMLGK